jgi:hypothetical protein
MNPLDLSVLGSLKLGDTPIRLRRIGRKDPASLFIV